MMYNKMICINLNNKDLEQVNSFTYLGMTPDQTGRQVLKYALKSKTPTEAQPQELIHGMEICIKKN